MISYCVCVYRPRLFCALLEDLIAKTTVPYEILVWLNTRAPDIASYIERLAGHGCPIRLVGANPENAGMIGYKMLFMNSRYEQIVQVHDDVTRVSWKIAETAQSIFRKHPSIKQIVSDVVQDAFTTGGRPGDDAYTVQYAKEALFRGPVDGWFSIYCREILPILVEAPYEPYFHLGSYVQMRLAAKGWEGLLCKNMKVFHVAGPAYAQLFDTVPAEVRKFLQTNKKEMADLYENLNPPTAVLDQMLQQYGKSVAIVDAYQGDQEV